MKQLSVIAIGLQRWQTLGPRDRRALAWGTALVSAALLWWFVLSPAIAVWREVPARIAAERATLQRLKDMAHVAQTMQSQPRAPGEASDLERLQLASAGLGDQATITPQGDALSVTLTAVSAEQWTSWLTELRLNARLKPAQVRLRADADGKWSGTLVFAASAP